MLKAAALGVAATLTLAGAADASVVISGASTKHMTCSAGVCSPTAANAVLNRRDLATMLSTSDVKVTTGAGAITIGITGTLSWVSPHRLTLDAQHSVSIRAAVSVKGTGGLTITLEDGPSGALNFYPGGSITFWDTASSLIINGNSYTLVNDIATLAQDIASNPAGFYALAKDYDASVDGTYTGSPVPTMFAGTTEGLGHVISNLSIDLSAAVYPGLFSFVAGAVRDLALTQANVNCDGWTPNGVGILAGQSSGRIDNSSASGSIACSGTTVAGGLVGYNNGGTINQSSADVAVSGYVVGGLVGANGGTISNSSASGPVSGGYNSYAGGLVGNNQFAIDHSHATGAVNAPGGFATGGLAGASAGNVTYSYATGNVAGKHSAGGLIGANSSVLVDNCFATGTASGEQYVGGLLGWHTANSGTPTVTNSYATGAATGVAQADLGAFVGRAERGSILNAYALGAVSGGQYTGGFVGAVSNTGVNAYWDLDTTGISDPQQGAGNHPKYRGITGLSDAQLKAGLPAGFDPAVWGQSAGINNGYPYLLANPPQ